MVCLATVALFRHILEEFQLLEKSQAKVLGRLARSQRVFLCFCALQLRQRNRKDPMFLVSVCFSFSLFSVDAASRDTYMRHPAITIYLLAPMLNRSGANKGVDNLEPYVKPL